MTTPTSSTQGQGLIRDAGHAYNAGEWVRAYELASALVRLEPENAEGHYLAGLSAIASSRASIAVTHFGKAASLDGRRADYAVQLARAHRRIFSAGSISPCR